MSAIKTLKKHSSSVEITICDIALEVFYDFTPFRQATRDPGGNITEPAEPASIDLTGIYLIDKGADILDLVLSVSDEDIEDALFEVLSDMEDSCE